MTNDERRQIVAQMLTLADRLKRATDRCIKEYDFGEGNADRAHSIARKAMTAAEADLLVWASKLPK